MAGFVYSVKSGHNIIELLATLQAYTETACPQIPCNVFIELDCLNSLNIHFTPVIQKKTRRSTWTGSCY